MSLAIIWLIVLVVCLVAEIATLGLTSIWFAGGALLALLIAMIGGPLWLQVLVFLVASIVLLIVTRPIQKAGRTWCGLSGCVQLG